MNKPVKPPVQLTIRAEELEPYRDVGGITLIPLNGKRPIHGNWPARNYNTAKVLAACQEQGRNVGARLSDSWLVIDVDPRNGGAAGFAALCPTPIPEFENIFHTALFSRSKQLRALRYINLRHTENP